MDATKRPLTVPPEFATYAEEHELFETFKRLLGELIVHKPEDPLAFLIDALKRDNDDVPQVLILGPPSSGKRSIAKLICGKLRTAHLTKESIIEEAEAGFKNEAKKHLNDGTPVPTELWVNMIKNRVSLFDAVKKGWVMDGFPETREQALALQATGIYPKHCVLLDAPDMVLIERSTGKRIDSKTGDIYHVTFDWPNNRDVIERLTECQGTSEADMIERLVVYHRHIDGLLKCYEKSLKVITADQPKTDVFSQVMSFLSRSPRSSAPHTPRVVLLGPTGSGKAVQATLLANKYNIINVSMGQLIKEAIADESKSGHACKAYVEKGAMVPDAIVLSILKDRLCRLDCLTRGWVLHGYPRTQEQAEQLSGAGLAPNRVFTLSVPIDSVLERLTMRATDPITGQRYHMLYKPPATQEVKDRLKVNPADAEEAVRKRLAQYSTYAQELADYYPMAQTISSDQDPHTVFETMESMMVNQLPKTLE